MENGEWGMGEGDFWKGGSYFYKKGVSDLEDGKGRERAIFIFVLIFFVSNLLFSIFLNK